MDPKNLFFSKNAFLLLRIDHLCMLVAAVVALVTQRAEVNWWHFFLAIAWQDAISFYPAAFVYYWPRRDRQLPRRMPRAFYIVYNIVHGVPMNMAVLLVWWLARGKWVPEMLAIPIHLCIDRGVAGRYFKSFSIAFEPKQHPVYAEFAATMEAQPAWGEAPNREGEPGSLRDLGRAA